MHWPSQIDNSVCFYVFSSCYTPVVTDVRLLLFCAVAPSLSFHSNVVNTQKEQARHARRVMLCSLPPHSAAFGYTRFGQSTCFVARDCCCYAKVLSSSPSTTHARAPPCAYPPFSKFSPLPFQSHSTNQRARLLNCSARSIACQVFKYGQRLTFQMGRLAGAQ
jgi:hypothetical protein